MIDKRNMLNLLYKECYMIDSLLVNNHDKRAVRNFNKRRVAIIQEIIKLTSKSEE